MFSQKVALRAVALSAGTFLSAVSLLACPAAVAGAPESNAATKETAAKDLPASVVPVSRSDGDWMVAHDFLIKRARSNHTDIAFFGDSITHGMNVDLLHQIIGPGALNFGIGGDRTQHLLWRLRNGELDFPVAPKAFVVLIGTNNISNWPNEPPSTNQEICLGVQADLKELIDHFPHARILLLAILPRDEKPNTKTRKRVSQTNELLKGLADNKHIWYADIGNAFLEVDGRISPQVMSDFLHPTQVEGYKRMFTAIKPHIDQMLGK